MESSPRGKHFTSKCKKKRKTEYYSNCKQVVFIPTNNGSNTFWDNANFNNAWQFVKY